MTAQPDSVIDKFRKSTLEGIGLTRQAHYWSADFIPAIQERLTTLNEESPTPTSVPPVLIFTGNIGDGKSSTADTFRLAFQTLGVPHTFASTDQARRQKKAATQTGGLGEENAKGEAYQGVTMQLGYRYLLENVIQETLDPGILMLDGRFPRDARTEFVGFCTQEYRLGPQDVLFIRSKTDDSIANDRLSTRKATVLGTAADVYVADASLRYSEDEHMQYTGPEEADDENYYLLNNSFQVYGLEKAYPAEKELAIHLARMSILAEHFTEIRMVLASIVENPEVIQEMLQHIREIMAERAYVEEP